MYFKRLEMHGFKSFAEQVSLEFMDGMTCIVGPNGSGKSNIADAIRWVLGEQSPKNLRGGKMDEVIFAGTERRKARGIAEVTLVIDNKDGILPIEYNEVAITRKMYRSGESDYLINGRICRLRDIKELIVDTGMGVEGYSIIGQGKISEIVNNRAEGRRELFEAAAGISKYRVRKNEAEKKLSHAAVNLNRVNDIILEIESRIDGLREDSIKAEEYLVLREKHKTIEINLAVRQAASIEERIKALQEDLLEAQKMFREYESEKESSAKDLDSIKEKISELDRLLEDTRNRLMEQLEEINGLNRGIEVTEEKLSAFERDINRLSGELLKDKLRFSEESAVLESMIERADLLEKKETEIKKQSEEKESEYMKAAADAAAKQEHIEKKKSQVFQLHSSISVGKTEILGLKSLIDGLMKRKIKIDEDIADARTAIEDLSCRAENNETEIDRLNEAIVRKNLEMEKDLAKKEDVLAKQKDIFKKKEEIENDIHKAVTKRDLLLGFENSFEGYGHAVRFIMSNRHRLKGVHGAAADLIDVPKGLETALQTALGASMQNIICDDDRCAAECIKVLKNERAGRATFLPVNSIRGGRNAAKGNEYRKLRDENGFLGFAVESVQYDPKYERIMEYLLGKVVIADTLENAVRLSKNYPSGVRFVTLDGDDINPSGVITGGRIKNSGPNLFERKNDIKTLGMKIEELSSELNDAEKQALYIEKQAEELTTKTEKAGLDIRATENELMSLKSSNDAVIDRRNVLEDNISRWEKETADIDSEIFETEKMIGDIQENIDRKLTEITASEGFMDDEVKAYETAKALADEKLEEISSLKIRVSGIVSDIRHNQESIRRSRFEVQRLSEILESKEKEKVQLVSEKEAADNKIDEDKVLLKAAKESYDKRNIEADRLKEEKELFFEKQQEILIRSRELDKLIDNNIAARHDIEIKVAKGESQLDAIKDRLWDSFSITFIEAQAAKQEDFAVGSATRESREIKNRMTELEPVNIGAIEEYKQVSQRYEFLTEQREDLSSAIDSLNGIIKDMDKRINVGFMNSFKEISEQFTQTFAELFGGGKAELKLEDEDNVLESAIDIIAQPPGKKLQNINLLSGGEKSLTAIALLCSILKVRPTPFCILDEVEAALDDVNIGRFVDYIKNFGEIQFVVVTHQKATMEKADVMYGITMPEKGISKVISLKLNDNKN
ncbi:MAG: chromosome segregation protein SMC [Firmicutes bacterium]|nr:chromosome segregation protein SMC [Bacillota bacterium]